jgi:uncharacterized low-complexity protein
MNTTKTVITLALTTALGSTGIAQAGENPFGMQVLKQGYQVAEAAAKSQEGKCGASKTMTKAKEGKYGEGKCGANKAKGLEGAE